MTKNKPYYFKWRDHFTSAGDHDSEVSNAEGEVVLESVGFFIKQNKYYYYFAQSIYESDYYELLSVLKNNIIEIKELN